MHAFLMRLILAVQATATGATGAGATFFTAFSMTGYRT